METKSRYEMISDLEEKKSKLLNVRANIDLQEAQLNVIVEKAQENVADFLAQRDIQLANVKDQIESIDTSLGRLNSQKK